jgi:hypothetical protein
MNILINSCFWVCDTFQYVVFIYTCLRSNTFTSFQRHISSVTYIKLKPFHYMPQQCLGGEEVKLLLILYLGTRCGWVVSVTPRLHFIPGKGPPVPIVQEDGWTQEPVWTHRLQEKSFCLCWGSNLDHPVIQPVPRHYAYWATRLMSHA